MMTIPLYQVDAFTSEPFRGNPAAVCLLDHERADSWMQQVAAEMNLSETAFVLPSGGGFRLRWFTPTVEVPLCGHATLATAHVLWETGRLAPETAVRFFTRSGELAARRVASGIELDFPARPIEEAVPPAGALDALGVRPRFCGQTPDQGDGDRQILIECESAEEVRACRPRFDLLRAIQPAIILTARSDRPEHDIVSRFFAPWWGIDEDPVTGVAHCALATYWSRLLGRNTMVAYQASARGGTLHVCLEGNRAFLAGQAVTVLSGALTASSLGDRVLLF
jgi:PhzF family phenazine biosynthesis protein